MRSSRLMGILLLLPGLAGCSAAEQTMSALLPDPYKRWPSLGLVAINQDRTTERAAVPRPKPATPPRPAPNALAPVEVSLPAWSVPATKPSTTLRYALPPSDLFRRLSPSVYTVSVSGQDARKSSQGSAVAISAREAVTNCHVVAQGNAIRLINGTINLKAEIVATDPALDRCFLRAEGGLEPVPGFRDYDSLQVGETVYTIGSPKGLGNSLGSGLLAGLRKSEDGADYVQITAPVSAGSSGGGLFDDRGNLIGITTFTIRDSQNLNFALAASHFFK